MPQMAPYNWLNLMMMFSLIMIIFISYIHFIKKYYYNCKKLKKNYFNWTW